MSRDILGKLRRAAGKPPGYIAQRAWQEGRRVADRWIAPARAAAFTDRRVLSLLGFGDVDEAWAALLERPFPFCTDLSTEALERLAPGEVAAILAKAEDALAHRIDLLGSGPVELGPTIDWHADFKTGRRWPPVYCHAIDYNNLDEPSDVKSPWELSRLQWLIPAAQAHILTGEARYAEGVRRVLEHWIAENPYAGSVNWSCTMEAAIRIFSFAWLIRALGRSEAFADPGFRMEMLRSLVQHADFTERYIERADVNGNHYTADAAGLAVAGMFLGEAPAARRWADEGWRILAEEMQLQVFPDGVDYEASVPYHRLVAELFLLPALTARSLGRTIPPLYRTRLAAMGRFTAAYTRNDGTSPVWGDNDDARALPMSASGLADHRYLVGLIGLALDEPDLAADFSGPVAEIAWTLGPKAAGSLAGQTRPPRTSRVFPDGGFYVLAHGDDHVFVDCGPLGLADRGGHGHNDLMSFEAALDGELLIVDPGCFVYTASPAERNAFRSTAYHNTPQVAGEEINRFVRPDYLWTLHCDARPDVRLWETGEGRTTIVMSHSGYERLRPPVRPVRRIELDHAAHRLTIEDWFEGRGAQVRIPLHLALGVSAAPDSDQMFRLQTSSGIYMLSWECAGEWSCEIQASRLAPIYGATAAGQMIVWKSVSSDEARIKVTVGKVT